MAIRLVLLTRKGLPFPKGLPVELLRGDEIRATARIDEHGVVNFDVDEGGAFAVRMNLSDTLRAANGH